MLILKNKKEDTCVSPKDEVHEMLVKAKRVPVGLFKSLINQQAFKVFNMMSMNMEAMKDQAGIIAFSYDANLWIPLSAAYGKCDCMVAGKYKKARVFAFETKNLHIWCVSETGDRGTGWFVTDKSEPLQKNRSGYCLITRWADNDWRTLEVNDFFKKLIIGAALAHPATMTAYAPSVAWLRDAQQVVASLIEARMLNTVVLEAPLRGRKLGL